MNGNPGCVSEEDHSRFVRGIRCFVQGFLAESAEVLKHKGSNSEKAAKRYRIEKKRALLVAMETSAQMAEENEKKEARRTEKVRTLIFLFP